MTKLRFERFDDQAYHVYLGLEGPIGTIRKMDDNKWHARTKNQIKGVFERVFESRGEAAEWLRENKSGSVNKEGHRQR